jgi:hypothetical protein
MKYELGFVGFLFVVFIISYFFLSWQMAFMLVMLIVLSVAFLYGSLFLFHKATLKYAGGKYDKAQDESKKPQIIETLEKEREARRRANGLGSSPEELKDPGRGDFELKAVEHRPAIQPDSEESGGSEPIIDKQIESLTGRDRKPKERHKRHRFNPI